MNLLKDLLPVIIFTGLILLCPAGNTYAADINIRRYTGKSDLTHNAPAIIADSTNFGSSSQLSVTRRFEFKRTGSGSLTIQSVTLSGTNAAEFAVIGFPSSLSSSWNVFSIRFTPVSGGNKTAQLTIRSNADNHPVFVINLSATADVCLPGNPVETSAGLHVSTQTTTAGGWTCYCNSAGNLLLALNTTGTGAVITTNGVELNIGSRRAEYFSHGTGFVGNIVGFTGVTKTWAINASTQPVKPVRACLFFTASDTTALSDTMRKYTGTRVSRLSNIMLYNVINNARPKHATIATLGQNDIMVYDNGSGSASWSESVISAVIFQAELSLGNLNTIGLGSSPGGITPLPVSFISQSAKPAMQGLRIEWQVVTEDQAVKFIVERSADGRQFSPIGTDYSNPSAVNGQVISYSFTDASPLTETEWATYRITAVADNGEQRQAPLMKVKMSNGNARFLVYPAENAPTWMVSMPAEATQGSIDIFDMNGAMVRSMPFIEAENNRVLDLNTYLLPTGIFIVRISDQAAGIFTARIANIARP